MFSVSDCVGYISGSHHHYWSANEAIHCQSRWLQESEEEKAFESGRWVPASIVFESKRILFGTMRTSLRIPALWFLSLFVPVAWSFQHNPRCQRSHKSAFCGKFQSINVQHTFLGRRGNGHKLTLFDASVSDPANLQSFLRNTDFWVFLFGIFPFAWATVEFWKRIAFGEAFGTGTDSVVIGMDDLPADSRGRRVLGKGALVTAYVLFALAFGTIGIVLYSVISSDAPPDVLPSTGNTNALGIP